MLARSPRAAFAALVSPWFVPAALFAQEPDRPDSLRRDSSAVRLAEVSVLGTRQPSRPLDTPLAMTQVAPEDAFGAAGYGLDDALQAVPGVLAQSRYGGSDIRLVIRGFGARGAGDRSNAGTSRGIRILLDGIPETEPDGRTSFDGIDLAAASDITVIRSNSSATWGNAAGGVVSISTVPAGAAGPAASVQLGSYGLQRYMATGSATVGRSLVYGSFVQTSFDGWRAHSWSNRSLANAGAVIPVGPSTTLRGFFMGTVNGFRIPGPLTAAQVEADPRQANATYAARDERRYNRVARLGVAVEHGTGRPFGVSALLFGAPKALERSERGTYRDFNRYHIGGNIVGRASLAYTPSLRATITAGVDEAYQDGSVRFYSLSPEGTRGSVLRTDKREPANNLGAFVQHDLAIGDRVTVGVGGRYDVIRYSYVDWLKPHLNDARSFRRLTPKATINLRLGPLQSLYASVGGGIEAPAGNEVDPPGTFGQDTVFGINPLLEPIVSTTYEIGTKQVVVPASGGVVRELAYDAALYLTDVRNEIVPYRGGQFYFTAGRARRMGAELGVRLRTAGDVSLAGAVTWAHNTYRQYVVDSAHYGRPGASADYGGHRIVGVPDVIVGGHVAYEPGWLAPARLQVGVQGNSRYWADDANAVPAPGFALFSATAGLRTPLRLGAGLALGGFVTVDNLFNRRYVASAFLNPDVVNGVPVAFEPGFGRRLLVSFSLLRNDT